MQENTFSIGYVSQATELPQSVLRYWETVFQQFAPYKTPGGTRRYTQEDIGKKLNISHDNVYHHKNSIDVITKKDILIHNQIIIENDFILVDE